MLRRIPVIMTLVVCTALGCAGQSGDQGKAQSDAASADRAALTELIQRSVAEIRHAWKVKDAKLVFKDTGQEPAARTPDGRTISLDDQIADIQRRMNMTRSIDYMTEEVESIDLRGDEAVVVSKQRFSRVMILPDGRERRRISSVTHRAHYRRTENGWRREGPIEESNPSAKWEDET